MGKYPHGTGAVSIPRRCIGSDVSFPQAPFQEQLARVYWVRGAVMGDPIRLWGRKTGILCRELTPHSYPQGVGKTFRYGRRVFCCYSSSIHGNFKSHGARHHDA